MINGTDLAAIFLKVIEEEHPAHQAYFDDENIKSVVVDGRIDFDRLAAVLNEEFPVFLD